VPAALIALDLGIVRDPWQTSFPYEGEPFFVENCNQDQTLASAAAAFLRAGLRQAGAGDRGRAAFGGLRALGFGNAAFRALFPTGCAETCGSRRWNRSPSWTGCAGGSASIVGRGPADGDGMIEIERHGDLVIRGKTGWSTDGRRRLARRLGGKGGETRVFAINIEMKRWHRHRCG
jgi:beta-lactamase class D